MITCLACGLTSDNDINGKCPVCWADFTVKPNGKTKTDKEDNVDESILYQIMKMNLAKWNKKRY